MSVVQRTRPRCIRAIRGFWPSQRLIVEDGPDGKVNGLHAAGGAAPLSELSTLGRDHAVRGRSFRKDLQTVTTQARSTPYQSVSPRKEVGCVEFAGKHCANIDDVNGEPPLAWLIISSPAAMMVPNPGLMVCSQESRTKRPGLQ